jgi:MFS family permease
LATRRDTLFPLAATTLVQLLVAMAVVAVPVLAPAASADIGIATGYVGLFIAIVYGCAMASTLLAGTFVQRYGAIRVSQICLASCAAGLGCVAGGTPALVVAGAVLLGFGYGPVTPASSHVLARNTPPGMMSFVFSVKQTGVPLGGAVAGAVVPALVLWAGWRFASLALGAACLAAVLLAQPLRAAFDAERDPHRRLALSRLAGPLRHTLSDPVLRRLAFCSFFFAGLQLCLITFLVTHLTLNLGQSLVEAGFMLAIAQGGGVVARIGWGAIADRWGRPLLLIGLVALAMGIAAVATALFTREWPAIAIAAVCAAFGATAIGWNGVYLAQVARLAPPGRAGDATGGSLVFTYAGVLAGPPAFAFLVEGGTGYPAAFVLAAIPAVACGLWLLAAERRAEGPAPAARANLENG